MAKVKLNPVIMQVRGQIGDLVFKRYEGRVILGRKNDLSEVEPNEAQLGHQERFRQAALYGKLVMADPAQKADYQAAAKALGKPVFSLTVADFPSTGFRQAQPTSSGQAQRPFCGRGGPFDLRRRDRR